MGAGFFIAAISISASAQIAATQAQIAAQQAQKTADLALQAQLDAISQRDALQAQLEDTTLASQRDSLQNQPKTGKAGANPGQQDVASAADHSQPRQEPQSTTSEALPVTLPPAAAHRLVGSPGTRLALASQNRPRRGSKGSLKTNLVNPNDKKPPNATTFRGPHYPGGRCKLAGLGKNLGRTPVRPPSAARAAAAADPTR
jgi:hypothetical protein